MLAKGQDTHKYFTKNHVLYERIEVCLFEPDALYAICCNEYLLLIEVFRKTIFIKEFGHF
jgi:hypothetical protein